MKKILKILGFIFTIFLLSSCGVKKDKLESDIKIVKPSYKNPLTGIWSVDSMISLKSGNEKYDTDDLFISDMVYKMKDKYVLNPTITARYMDVKKYFMSKAIQLPDELKILDGSIVIYRLSNQVSYSQEFLKIGNQKILTIDQGNIFIYKKKKEIDDKMIKEKYEIISSIIGGKAEGNTADFGLAVSFRKKNTVDKDGIVNYSYFTYFMKRMKSDSKPKVFAINDIVFPKDSGIWTVTINKLIDEKIEDNSSEVLNKSISAFPSLTSNPDVNNSIIDTVFRRIDYVNEDYIGLTRLNFLENSVAENYEIYPLTSLSKRSPVKISSIAGNDGYQYYVNTLKENINLISTEKEKDALELIPDPTNIGLRRIPMNWKFVSSLDLNVNRDGDRKIYKNFDLNIIPIVNIGNDVIPKITWRDIIEKVPSAIDASVSPENNYVLIQDKNQIYLYPIYYNNIGVNPLFSIQDTNGYEIVMNKWIRPDEIKGIYDNYKKLGKIPTQVIFK